MSESGQVLEVPSNSSTTGNAKEALPTTEGAAVAAPAAPLFAPPTATELPPVLTVREVAKYLRIGINKAYRAVREGEIPGARRIGKRTIRVDRDTVIAWHKAGQGRLSRQSRGSR
jgi:excisionase family DNA binding protein